jgi:magnesium transporter
LGRQAFELLRSGHFEEAETLEAGLTAARRDNELLWVTLDHPALSDFVQVERALGLHPLAVEDAVRARERPKLDVYDAVRFVSLTTLRYDGPAAPLDVGRLMAFVGEEFIVVVRQEDGDTLERARWRMEHDPHPATPLEALHALLGTVVDDLADVSTTIEGTILAAADRLFGPKGSDEAQTLYDLSRQLLAMTHAVQPLIEPLRHLSSGTSGHVDVETGRRFQDVLDHALVVDREIDGHSELVEHLRSSNDSRIALQQNTDMRKIAAWAAVIAVPAAITGFYGMNVPYPGFGEPAGVVAAAALQLLSAMTLFVLFRRRGWL